jgi:hypothetical protein
MQESDTVEIRRFKMNELGKDCSLEYEYKLIPYISEKPTPEAFDLPDEVTELATYLDERDRIRKSHKRLTLSLISIVTAVWFIMSLFAFGKVGYSTDNLFSFMNAMLACGLVLLMVVWPIAALINTARTPSSFRSSKKTYEPNGEISSFYDPRNNYKEFKKQLSMYEYWNKRRSLVIWAQLNDRELNASLTQLYRRNGYKVKFEHQFYGDHREISVEKDGKKTLVYPARSGNDINVSIITGLAKMAKFDSAIVVSVSAVSDDIRKLANKERIEVLDWQKIFDLV